MNIDFSVWYARIEKRKPFISINAPLFGDCFGVNLNFVISCVDFFSIRIKINLSSIDTHAHKRATKYRFVQHSFTTYIVFVYIYLCVLCCSRFLFVSCVKYLRLKICNETNQKRARTHAQQTFHRDKMANFIFRNRNWTASHQQSSLFPSKFLPESSLKLRFISRMKCSILPFYVSFFLLSSVHVGLTGAQKKHTHTK